MLHEIIHFFRSPVGLQNAVINMKLEHFWKGSRQGRIWPESDDVELRIPHNEKRDLYYVANLSSVVRVVICDSEEFRWGNHLESGRFEDREWDQKIIIIKLILSFAKWLRFMFNDGFWYSQCWTYGIYYRKVNYNNARLTNYKPTPWYRVLIMSW
jgi:hypothetical protein